MTANATIKKRKDSFEVKFYTSKELYGFGTLKEAINFIKEAASRKDLKFMYNHNLK